MALNSISSLGAVLLGASTLPFPWNVVRRHRYGRVAVDDPWGTTLGHVGHRARRDDAARRSSATTT